MGRSDGPGANKSPAAGDLLEPLLDHDDDKSNEADNFAAPHYREGDKEGHWEKRRCEHNTGDKAVEHGARRPRWMMRRNSSIDHERTVPRGRRRVRLGLRVLLLM